MPAAPNKTMTGTEWAMLLALSALWGGSFFFTGIAVKELPPLTIVLLRVGLAALILNIVTRALDCACRPIRVCWRS
jgi:drug/metabolite transporter (DMT)-like permease